MGLLNKAIGQGDEEPCPCSKLFPRFVDNISGHLLAKVKNFIEHCIPGRA